MSHLPEYEKLGWFYLGKTYDLAERKLLDNKLLYDARNLTTHALCVGMTGSGKTGLCLSLLEEAAIDGIPAIAVDPKGDLGNLLLTFPELRPADFAPWVDESEAARKGLTPDQLAEETAAKWRSGLESWEQDGPRIARLREAIDLAIYTPASKAGLPLTVLKSFDAPPQEAIDDEDVFRERIAGAASGLLTLLGLDADPLTSREHILLSNIFESMWRKGQHLDLPNLIRLIQTPPIDKVGVFDLDSFLPPSERTRLAMSLNNLLASPSFAGWLQGEPLDIKRLLYTPSGKPRLSIISIAHLGDAERMFFVTLLLNELLSWVRTQPGTSSLRAIFYMDEVFGYFPPTAKPPSKPPMLTLLKQARAFGLGIALATQNPIDLDYRGLSNIGTWFLGRLQTQRDKDRVLDGLEGAATQAGARFNRAAMEQTLASLGSRVFLMNNVHEDQPTVFQSRWALSYLRGPLSRQQIQTLMGPAVSSREIANEADGEALSSPPPAPSPAAGASPLPMLPAEIEQRYLVLPEGWARSDEVVYLPALYASASCHFVRTGLSVDFWQDVQVAAIQQGEVPGDVWQNAKIFTDPAVVCEGESASKRRYGDVPTQMMNAKLYKSWEKDLVSFLYRHHALVLYECKELKLVSRPGEDEIDARTNWMQLIREKRDAEKDQLRAKYAKQLDAIEAKINTARERVEREKAQYDREKWETALDFGQSILGALLGKRTRATTTARRAGRAVQQRTDVTAAEGTLRSLITEKEELESQCASELAALQNKLGMSSLDLEEISLPCRKSDMHVRNIGILWIPVRHPPLSQEYSPYEALTLK